MATSFAPTSIAGGCQFKARDLQSVKAITFGKAPSLVAQRKVKDASPMRKFPVCAAYRDGNRGGGSDFIAGFLIGGALFGTLAYAFAPQIRRTLLNEDEHGFRKPRGPVYYYDDGLERTRQTLNEKIHQLNSAIDNVSSRLRGGKNNTPVVPVETDPEFEATI